MLRTGNPALRNNSFTSVASSQLQSTDVMTLDGTVNKALIAIGLTMLSAYWAWSNPLIMGALPIAAIGGFIIAIIITFKKAWAPVLTPVYALLEGVVLGTISVFSEMQYPGIVFQAVSLTFGTLLCLLLAYKSGAIKVTENFKLGIVAATGAIAVLYLVSIILSLFGVPVTFLHSATPLSIGISVVVVVIAALNLVLDFDFIENASEQGNVPKYMEWYGAFGLLVTLVWLYLEILRLLSKLQSRK